MAVRIKRSDLTEAQVDTIRKVLFLQPVAPPVYGQQQHFYQANGATKPPILFYLYDEATQEVTIPYTFSWILTGKVPNVDKVYTLLPFTFKGDLFDHQKPVEEEAYQHLLDKGSTTIGLYPGFGKTVVGAKLAARLGLPVVVLYHREFLGPQWEKTFADFTNATTWIVGTPAPPHMPNVTLCMATRVHLLPPEYRARIGCMIIDEAHAFCTPSRLDCLLGFTPRYVIAETATLERDDGMHSMIQAICGLHGIFRSSSTPFEVVKIDTGFTPPTTQTAQGRLNWSELVKTLATNPHRNQFILDIIRENPERKIVVLTGLVEHVHALVKMIREMGEKVDFMAGTKKSYSDSRVLVGTIQKIGTGFDEKTACPDFNGIRIDMLILVTSVKKLSTLEQSVGRVFRAQSPIVIDFVDNNSTLKSHWYGRQKWYKSRLGEVSVRKMNFPDQIDSSTSLGSSDPSGPSDEDRGPTRFFSIETPMIVPLSSQGQVQDPSSSRSAFAGLLPPSLAGPSGPSGPPSVFAGLLPPRRQQEEAKPFVPRRAKTFKGRAQY